MDKKLIMIFLIFGCEGTFILSDDDGRNDLVNDQMQGDASTSVLDGQALYEKYCSSCHGADEGNTIWPGSIQSYEPIRSIVIDGRGTMPAIDISVEQSDKIQTFLLSLGESKLTLDGEGLYTRYCSSCHGADAKGNEVWPVSIQGYDPIDLIVSEGRGTMAAIELEDQYVDKIQEYLLSLAPPLADLNGTQVYERLCAGCHGEAGEGGERGMQLRYNDFAYSNFWTRSGRIKSGDYAVDMPAYPESTISEIQLEELFDYLDSMPHAEDGEGLYLQFCGNCHGIDGSGGPSGKGIAGSDDDFTEVIRKGKGEMEFDRRGTYMSAWNIDQLSASEIQNIMTYTRGL